MDQHLYKFLVWQGHLAIPKLGSFVIEKKPARFEEGSGELLAPQSVISFSEGEVPVSEKLFFSFLAAETGLDEVAAIQEYHAYCQALRTKMTETGSAVIEGIGKLSRGEDGVIVLQSGKTVSYLTPPVKVGNAVSIASPDGAEGTERDLWWFYALILGILGLGALAYYYM